MPRSQGDNVSEGNESIVIRGPKKGVEAVKKEVRYKGSLHFIFFCKVVLGFL